MEMRLDRLMPGRWATVTAIAVPKELRRRLRDFGLVVGTKVCCRYRSPRSDVTALELRGTVIALRTRDLKLIRCVG